MAASATPPSTAHLALPFFDDAHRALARDLLPWAAAQSVDERDDRAACRDWVERLGQGGWLRYCVPAASGGALERLDSRALVLLRETLAFHSPLADFAFAMQGLGSGAITLAGSAAQQRDYLGAVARGDKIAAFALSEPDAGSDVGAMAMRAVATPQGWRLDGEKTWISNGGIADFYCVFARPTRQPDRAASPPSSSMPTHAGLDSSAHIEVMAPHPLATLRFEDCTVPREAQLGELNGGFKLAMRTLDIFRASVAGAALGMARRALAEAVRACAAAPHVRPDAGRLPAHAGQARRDGRADRQRRAADLPRRLDARRQRKPRHAAGRRHHGRGGDGQDVRHRERERVIDMALQMHGGLGVKVGTKVESLYRDIRSLRIYEGATEVQQLIIGKAVLRRPAS